MSSPYEAPKSEPQNEEAVKKAGGLRSFRAKLAFWTSVVIWTVLLLAFLPSDKWIMLPIASAFISAFTAAIAALLPIRNIITNTAASIFLMFFVCFLLGLAQMML